MNTEKIKNEVKNFLGKRVKVRVNVGRNKYEHYEGIVLKMYPYLFTIFSNGLIKSISYSDLLTKDVQIKLSNA